MRNPTPGRNPFELGSYIERFPLIFQWLYIDLNRDFLKIRGRASVKRFWTMYIMSFIFLCLVYVLAEWLVSTVMVYFCIMFLGWLYVSIPCVTIGVRRLHDMGKPGFLAVFPQFGTLFLTICVAFQSIPQLPLVGMVAAMSIIPLVFMSLPGQPFENKYGSVPTDEQPLLTEQPK